MNRATLAALRAGRVVVRRDDHLGQRVERFELRAREELRRILVLRGRELNEAVRGGEDPGGDEFDDGSTFHGRYSSPLRFSSNIVSAVRRARATMVSVGFFSGKVVNELPSATKRLGT